ncbi:MAG TPA: hypothetical protein VN380_21335 [Thermoanaerobaculia bacterium]|jgi:hypothetical protein|nr:hypothetical protein [Thermoanaerobaculia bacterium]
MPTRKDQVVIIRLSADEKSAFKEAADLAGIGLSSWIRERLRRTSSRELDEVGRTAPFIAAARFRAKV